MQEYHKGITTVKLIFFMRTTWYRTCLPLNSNSKLGVRFWLRLWGRRQFVDWYENYEIKATSYSCHYYYCDMIYHVDVHLTITTTKNQRRELSQSKILIRSSAW